MNLVTRYAEALSVAYIALPVAEELGREFPASSDR